MPKNIAIFASGSGSNAENIIRFFSRSDLFHFPVIVSNRADAFVHRRAEDLNIRSVTFGRKEFETGEAVLELLREYRVDAIVLAGFLLKVPELLIDAFPERIINIHPALLPSFPGLHGQKQAVDYGVKFSGCTVHFVDAGTDSGPIILQKVVPVMDDDTEDTLADRILVQEHIAMPEALKLWAEGKLTIEGRKVKVKA